MRAALSMCTTRPFSLIAHCPGRPSMATSAQTTFTYPFLWSYAVGSLVICFFFQRKITPFYMIFPPCKQAIVWYQTSKREATAQCRCTVRIKLRTLRAESELSIVCHARDWHNFVLFEFFRIYIVRN